MIELLLQAERALAVGQLDQADRMYRQAADLDPRNSIAVVGLARVALERADDRGALRLARRALEIDPENAAARRLADRLEEVMRHRGEDPGAVPMSEVPVPPSLPAPTPARAEPAPTTAPSPTAESPVPPPRPAAPPRRRPSILDRILRRS